MKQFNHSISIGYIVCFAAIAFIISGQNAARSVLCGGGLMYVNFLLLYKIGKMVFEAKQSGERAKGGVFMLLKLLGLFAAAYICLTYFKVNLLWFAASAAGMILTIAFFTAKQQNNTLDQDQKE